MSGRTLVIACGALAHEIRTLIRANGWDSLDVEVLPAELHNTPREIAPRVRARIAAARGAYELIFVAYADCGTGGALDAVLREEGVERLPGAHCYELYAGAETFAALAAEAPGTFYLTDFLARSFQDLVWRGLGLDQHPELRADYFGKYTRVVYLAQTENPELVARARAAAERLGLPLEVQQVGYGDLERALSLAPRRVS